jgi:putative tributyrin esterase
MKKMEVAGLSLSFVFFVFFVAHLFADHSERVYMALVEIAFRSTSIDMASRMIAIVPDAVPGPYAVFYLLHGLTSDYTSWTRRSSLERYVGGPASGGSPDGLPLIVVMPDTARGWYTNAVGMPAGAVIGKYEDHIVKDVVPFVDRIFPTKADRAHRVIGGLSMGGYGAVNLALKYPQMFSAATSHSGAVMTPLHRLEERTPDAQALRGEFEFVFGKEWRGGENDSAALAEKCPKEMRPKLRLDCGTEDFLLGQNRDFHAHLEKIGYAHEYEEFPGEHNWAYWDVHIQEAIAFLRRHLGI